MKVRAMHKELSAVVALTGLMLFAEVPPMQDGKIVIDTPGTYTLDAATNAAGVYFNAPATVDGATLTLDAPAVVAGGGCLMTPLAGSNGLYVSNYWASSDSVYPQKGSATLLMTNACVAEMTNLTAFVRGYWTSWFPRFLATKTVAFTKNAAGTEATAQFHTCTKNWAVAFKVKFTQSGSDIYGEIIWAKYCADKTKSGQDWEVIPITIDGNYENPFSFERIGITRFSFGHDLEVQGTLPGGTIRLDARTLTVRPDADVTITACLTGGMGKLAFVGSKTSLQDTTAPQITFSGGTRNTFSADEFVMDGITVNATTPYLLPVGANLVLTNYASYAVTSGSTTKGFPNNCTVTVNKECRVSVQQPWSTADSAKFVVDGGELNLHNAVYLQYLTLRNGGKLTGSGYVVGYQTADGYTRTYGTETCIIECTIRGAKDTARPALSHVFDTAADLRLTTGLGDQAGWVGATWVKRGDATLAIEGNGSTATGGSASGSFTVEAGKIFFGANEVICRTNAFTLAGGVLDGGAFTNRLGTLAVTTNSTLVAGTGALTFSDSSAVSWTAGAQLSVTGATESLTAGHVRFLGTGLTQSQLDAMRYNGELRLKLDDNGWLRSYRLGLLILFL